MIGALDMFYLPHFEKIYHKEHIPFHYELVVGYDDEADTMDFCGGFDKAAVVLSDLGKEYNDKNMIRAAKIFADAAPIITQIKEIIVAYLSGNRDETDQLPNLFKQVADDMKLGLETL